MYSTAKKNEYVSSSVTSPFIRTRSCLTGYVIGKLLAVVTYATSLVEQYLDGAAELQELRGKNSPLSIQDFTHPDISSLGSTLLPLAMTVSILPLRHGRTRNPISLAQIATTQAVEIQYTDSGWVRPSKLAPASSLPTARRFTCVLGVALVSNVYVTEVIRTQAAEPGVRPLKKNFREPCYSIYLSWSEHWSLAPGCAGGRSFDVRRSDGNFPGRGMAVC